MHLALYLDEENDALMHSVLTKSSTPIGLEGGTGWREGKGNCSWDGTSSCTSTGGSSFNGRSVFFFLPKEIDNDKKKLSGRF